jgi:hypothetical protein
LFSAPQVRVEPESKMDVAKVIDQGVQAVFEREWMARTGDLISEIVRPAPGQPSNYESENALNNEEAFVRKKIDGQEMITTRVIIAEEEAIIGRIQPLLSRDKR